MGEHRRTRGNDGPEVTDDWPAFERAANSLGSERGSTTGGQSWIPGNSHIGDTLGDAGYPAPLYQPGVSQYVLELAHHPAVVKHGHGMSSADLASFTEALASLAQSRVKGVGHEQYAGETGQQFEGMTPYQVAEYALEEFADVVNYASMSAIKILAAVRAMGAER